MIRHALLFVFPMTLLACGSEPEVSDSGGTGEAKQAPTSNPLIDRFDDTVILVDSNGVGPKGDELFRFGSARDEVDGALAKAYGSEAKQADCADPGTGDMGSSDFGPLQLIYEDDKMVGWVLRPGGRVTTIDGIRPGVTTYSDLRTERPVRRIASAYPGGFEYTSADYGTIGGSVDGDRIVLLTVGLNCSIE